MIAARALEQFLEELITKTALITNSLQAKTLTPEHIRQHIASDARLSFLHDLAARMATGPNNSRSCSTSSATSTPTITTNRSPFQQQLSIPYQEALPSATSSNLLYMNPQLSRSYSSPYYKKLKTKKRSFDLVDNEEDEDDEDDQPITSDHPAT